MRGKHEDIDPLVERLVEILKEVLGSEGLTVATSIPPRHTSIMVGTSITPHPTPLPPQKRCYKHISDSKGDSQTAFFIAIILRFCSGECYTNGRGY